MSLFKKSNQELTPWQQAVKNQKPNKKTAIKHSIPKPHLFKSGWLQDFQIKNLKTFMPLIGLLLVAIGVTAFFITPYSRLNQITITGNKLTSTKKIMQYVPVSKNDSIFSVWRNTAKLEAQMKNQSQRLERVKFKLVNFNNLKITVKEYPTIGYLYTDKGYHTIFKSGAISSGEVLNPQTSYPVLTGFKNQKTIRKTVNQYKLINPSVRAKISSINYAPSKINAERIFIKMNDQNRVYATISSFGDKMEYYPSIKAKLKTVSVINLEVGAYSYPYIPKVKKDPKATKTAKDKKPAKNANTSESKH